MTLGRSSETQDGYDDLVTILFLFSTYLIAELEIHVLIYEEDRKLPQPFPTCCFIIRHQTFYIRLRQWRTHPDFIRQASVGPMVLSVYQINAVRRYVAKFTQKWLPALQSLGIPTNDRPLAGSNIGASQQPSDMNPSNTTRSYSAAAYLFPNAARKNLFVLTSALVEKINWLPSNSGGNVIASGVTFTSGGKEYSVAANKEVLISGGTVNSPQLLELSGIGAKDILDNAGVKQVVNLPSV